ncbi:MAG: PKD domain-containing protein [Ketobacteraceae bacterium]|nr:PKD domain-containing protein [Ketobacteraceae bacterium]
MMVLLPLGCGGSGSGSAASRSVAETSVPVSHAGNDQTVAVDTRVQLSGEQSYDPGNQPISFRWQMISKPENSVATLSRNDIVKPSFVADSAGVYRVQLIARNSAADGAPDYVNIEATENNIPPVAEAGSNVYVSEPRAVELDGSNSYDGNNDTLSFQWQLIDKPASSNARLLAPTTASPELIPDREGNYMLELIVFDGQEYSQPDTVLVAYNEPADINNPPVAAAGVDQNTTQALVRLDGSGSSDPDNDTLSFQWRLVSKPDGSAASLNSSTVVDPVFTADLEGSYLWELVVSDGVLSSEPDRVVVRYDIPDAGTRVISFDGSGALGADVTNNASALPDVARQNGRYRANLTDNSDEITLHYHDAQGRLDAWRTRFPFEFIARNVGIGTQQNSQTPHPYGNSAYNFAGVQVHVPDLESRNSAHVVVGHRGGGAPFTVEGKNTRNGRSSVSDVGARAAPDARADIRILGDENGQLTVYWQQPNMNADKSATDNWIPYGGTGRLPGTPADFGGAGSEVYVGLITYAFRTAGIPFVGTCDSIQITEY